MVYTKDTVRNLTRFNEDIIDCEILSDDYGWIPFSANINDGEEATKGVYAYIDAESIDVSNLEESPAAASAKKVIELSWRDGELAFASDAILRTEDGDTSVEGSTSDWRKYRVALRSWPDSPDFMNADKRPTRPID